MTAPDTNAAPAAVLVADAPHALQWTPSGSHLDGVPGEMLAFLAAPDGTTWGYGGGPGATMSFGTGPRCTDRVNVLAGRRVDGTFTVQDDAPGEES